MAMALDTAGTQEKPEGLSMDPDVPKCQAMVPGNEIKS
jgi:hypothetical protein